MHGGRIHLTELVPLLNISLHAIEARAQEIVQSSPDIHMVLGQLIDDTYLNSIVEEINETLQQNGQLSVQDLTKQYELSTDFLLQVGFSYYLIAAHLIFSKYHWCLFSKFSAV